MVINEVISDLVKNQNDLKVIIPAPNNCQKYTLKFK